MVAVPVAADQMSNAREIERLGFGLYQPYSNLDETEFYNALDSVLHDSKFKENAEKLGSALNDQLTRPTDRAVWWVEHLMRHPKMYQGRSPVHKLHWFQYFLLDVIAFYVFVIYLAVKFVSFVVYKVCTNSDNSKIKRS